MKKFSSLALVLVSVGGACLPHASRAEQAPDGTTYFYDQDCKGKSGAGWSITVIPGGGPHHIECDYNAPQGTDENNISGVHLGDSLASTIRNLQTQGYYPATTYNVVSDSVLFDGHSVKISSIHLGRISGIYIGDDIGLGEFLDYYSNPQERDRYPILGTYLPFVKEDNNWTYTFIVAASPVSAKYADRFYDHSRVIGERLWIKSKGLFDNHERDILRNAINEKLHSPKYSLTDEGAKVTIAQFGYSTFIAQGIYQEASRQAPSSVQKPSF